jgi:hypothetical protein
LVPIMIADGLAANSSQMGANKILFRTGEMSALMSRPRIGAIRTEQQQSD